MRNVGWIPKVDVKSHFEKDHVQKEEDGRKGKGHSDCLDYVDPHCVSHFVESADNSESTIDDVEKFMIPTLNNPTSR